MKVFGKIVYAGVGVLLAGAVLLTSQRGLNKRDYEAYNTGLQLQTCVDDLGFENFNLEDYPVAFYDGNKEYVLYKGETTTRKPVLGNLVGTTWKVNGRYEVLVPTEKDMARIMNVAAGIESTARPYGVEEHTATIWHEAFHAWQMTHYEDNFKEILNPDALAGQDTDELFWQIIDETPALTLQMEQEIELLFEAYKAKEAETCKEFLSQYFAQREKRLAALPAHIKMLEDFYELSEGGASYVEAKVYMEQLGQEMYNEKYIVPAGSFVVGAAKYYRTGLLKYLLMDKLDSDWKTGFDSSNSMDFLLKQALGS